jgi:hypothetical protein
MVVYVNSTPFAGQAYSGRRTETPGGVEQSSLRQEKEGGRKQSCYASESIGESPEGGRRMSASPSLKRILKLHDYLQEWAVKAEEYCPRFENPRPKLVVEKEKKTTEDALKDRERR